jgi:hypothetical protein
MSKSIAFTVTQAQAAALGMALANLSQECTLERIGTDRVSERGRVTGDIDKANAALQSVFTIAPHFRDLCAAVIAATADQGSQADAREQELSVMIADPNTPANVLSFLKRELASLQKKRANMANAHAKRKASAPAASAAMEPIASEDIDI